jgi:hypothetical protein
MSDKGCFLENAVPVNALALCQSAFFRESRVVIGAMTESIMKNFEADNRKVWRKKELGGVIGSCPEQRRRLAFVLDMKKKEGV